MKAIIQTMALLLLGISVILIANGCGKPRVLTLRAVVDGKDVVKVSSDRLWIEHEEWELPTQFFVNGKAWRPVWTDKTTAPLEGLSPAFHPRDSAKVKLTQLKGRGTVSVIQLPNPGNDQTLAFRIDDGSFSGADTYQISVAW